jgi:putative Mn2+ efflux pump MntP
MHYIEIIIIGIGLAMDAFAVSVTSGVSIKKMELKHSFIIAIFFGGFQGIMPIIGWSGGMLFKDYIQSVAHWIAFVILTLIGLKMIYDSTKLQEEKVENNPHNIYVLFTLAVATSIDALAAGITFSCLNYNIWEAAAIIGIITFILSFIGAQLGKTLGDHLGEYKIEILGGIILIGIGVKIVLERVL